LPIGFAQPAQLHERQPNHQCPSAARRRL